MKITWKRMLALLLCVLMVCGSAPAVMAEDLPQPTEIRWKWDNQTLIAGETYSYADQYEVFPANADHKAVELICSDPTVIEVNEAAQTFTVNEYPGRKKYINVTLTLKAKDSTGNCKDVDKEFLVLGETPKIGIHWDCNVNPRNEIWLRFYENEENRKAGIAARYWYEATAFNGLVKNSYYIEPSYMAAVCDITVTSSDDRIMKVDKATKSLIPVGNGRCTLTITATTPFGTRASDSTTAIVIGSDYTPSTGVQIGINEKKSNKSNYSVMSASSIRLEFNKSVVLEPMAPTDKYGTFTHDTFELTLEDGRVITVYEAPKIVWKSDNPSAVTVDKDGKVTLVGLGLAQITVTVGDNGVQMESSVQVSYGHSPQNLGFLYIMFLQCLFMFRWKQAGVALSHILEILLK